VLSRVLPCFIPEAPRLTAPPDIRDIQDEVGDEMSDARFYEILSWYS
jgi:hypothetical protein